MDAGALGAAAAAGAAVVASRFAERAQAPAPTAIAITPARPHHREQSFVMEVRSISKDHLQLRRRGAWTYELGQ
jgi:hypothetical protein